jgi:hypothetical protein
MSVIRKSAALCLALLVLGGCGKKPAQHSSASGSAPISFSADCPSAPEKSAIQTGIHNAMAQIYGTDEASAQFTVLKIEPTDCRHLDVSFRPKGEAGTPQTVSLVDGNDGKWSLTLYGKQYPVD